MAGRSTAGSPRNSPSSAWVESWSSISSASTSVIGTRRIATSATASASTPPMPTSTVGPNCSSWETPAISSRVPETMGATSTPVASSSGLAASSSSCAAAATAPGSDNPRRTSPRSVLCAICSPHSLTATGRPTPVAASAAISASVTRCSGAKGTPKPASRAFESASDSVRDMPRRLRGAVAAVEATASAHLSIRLRSSETWDVHRDRDLARDVPRAETDRVSAREIDDYLAALDEPKRGTLEQLRRTILGVVPDAEQCISYGMPAFKLDGKAVAGFGAFKHHLSYFPHSGSVIPGAAGRPRRLHGIEGNAAVPDRHAVARAPGEEAHRRPSPAARWRLSTRRVLPRTEMGGGRLHRPGIAEFTVPASGGTLSRSQNDRQLTPGRSARDQRRSHDPVLRRRRGHPDRWRPLATACCRPS